MSSYAYTLCAVALLLPSCIPGGGDDKDTRSDQHTLTVNWSVKNADGTPHSCAPPFDTLAIVATGIEDNSRDSQERVLVPCAATGSVSLDIYTSGELDFMMPDDPTTYTWSYHPMQEVVIYNTEDSGMNSRADSIERYVTLDGDKSVDIELYPEAGFAMTLWEINSMATGSSITCMWNCDNVDPDFPYLSEGQVFDAGNGRSRALAPGNYIGTTRALRSGTEVGREDDVEFLIETGNKVTPMGSTTLVILDR
jgi:hypothetical protein